MNCLRNIVLVFRQSFSMKYLEVIKTRINFGMKFLDM